MPYQFKRLRERPTTLPTDTPFPETTATLINIDGEMHFQFDIEMSFPYVCMMHGLDGLDYVAPFYDLDHVPSEDLAMMVVYERYVDMRIDNVKDILYIATRIIDFVDEEEEAE
jgi:hypothetical protein